MAEIGVGVEALVVEVSEKKNLFQNHDLENNDRFDTRGHE